MTTPFDPASLSMTEIIRLQTVLSQELTRRFERKAALAFTDVVDSTRYLAQFGDENRHDEFFKGMAFDRPATPEEIASTVAFMASERSSYTTGVFVTLDGGMASAG